MLQQALQDGVPCHGDISGEVAVRQMSSRLGQTLLEAGMISLPDMATVSALVLLAWATSADDLQLDTPELLREVHARHGGKAVDLEYSKLARESLEVLTLAISLPYSPRLPDQGQDLARLPGRPRRLIAGVQRAWAGGLIAELVEDWIFPASKL